MICPRCKQVLRTLVFGFACGCTVLSGYAEEPPQSKWFFQQPKIEVNAISTSSAALSTNSFGFGNSFTWIKPKDST